jgi:2-keto-4-pentenoate hydratase/2-oxohepta-3-ene-1,7-dioic acid hydratase in catechol pathway
MRLVTFRSGQEAGEKLGALLEGERVLDLREAARLLGEDVAPLAGMLTLIEAGAGAREDARRLVEQAPEAAVFESGAVQLLAPLPRPAQMRDFLCFEKHLKQSFGTALRMAAALSDDPAKAEAELRASGRFDIPAVWYQQPIYYKCNRFSISGPGDTIEWPAYANLMDYELELAAVIGIRGKDIPAQEARAHIFGFTIFNDFSARDAQLVETPGMLGPAKGKDFDGANALGPCIVTTDEIGDPYALTMVVRVNGEERARGNSGTMHWKFEDMIAHASRSETLHSGEILGSGTVGDGCGLEHMRFLEDGDVVELEVERIGVLRNRIARKAPPS